MAFQFQGWADAPSTGAYQEHEIAPVFEQAIADTQFVKLASRVPYSSGDSVTLPAISDLDVPTSSLLSESQSIPLDKLSITTKTIALQERGRGVMVSSRNVGRAPIDLLRLHEKRLQEQLRLDMDAVFATAFKSTKLVYAPTGIADYDLATSGTAGAAALANVNFYHLRKMRDLARRDYLMPKIGGMYRLIISTSGFRSILDDPERLELQSGLGMGGLQEPSRVKIEDVLVEECNHDSALDDDVGTNSDVAEAVFIADEAVKFAMGKMPSIVWDRTHDHGRYTSLAWWGDYAVGTSTDSANSGFVRAIYVSST